MKLCKVFENALKKYELKNKSKSNQDQKRNQRLNKYICQENYVNRFIQGEQIRDHNGRKLTPSSEYEFQRRVETKVTKR